MCGFIGQEAREELTASSFSVIILLIQHICSRLQGVQIAMHVAGQLPHLHLSRM